MLEGKQTTAVEKEGPGNLAWYRGGHRGRATLRGHPGAGGRVRADAVVRGLQVGAARAGSC